MLHWVNRLDGLGVPSPINPRDPTTFVKEESPREADQDEVENTFIKKLSPERLAKTRILQFV